MIKIYTDLKNIPVSFFPKVYEHNPNIELTDSIAECNFILLPFWEVINEWDDERYEENNLDPGTRSVVRQSVDELIEIARKHNKKLLIFQFSDSDEEIPVENAVLFRTSLYQSRKKSSEFAFPSATSDLVKEFRDNVLEIRKKKPKPSVGFVGSSRPMGFTLFDFVRSTLNLTNQLMKPLEIPILSRYQWNNGQILRKKAMVKLSESNLIDTDFEVIIRGYINQKNPERRDFNRNRFVNSIFNNDYTLCVRGAGNYSFRFYETLSAGRIPLFINTDCVLPLDSVIDWKKYCVWVEEGDIKKIDQILLDFHSGLSNTDFEELQTNIRKLWEERICTTAFYRNLDKYLV